jgi:large subunit ribosomal protein L24
LQATLLGLSVAIILALVAALVGPHFVDWTQYRARFETEATRLAGVPVRIGGPIDVRLLPTPTLTLGRVEIGSATQPQAKAREVHTELALGSLMRGAFQASELRVAGPEVSLGVTANGSVEWPAIRAGFDPDQFLIDKVSIEDGRIALLDGASGIETTLERFWFKGDLRSLVGPAKGEGGFVQAGERYGYRLAASRVGDDGSIKLRLGLDPADRPLSIEADGALRLEENSPRFDGTLTLARPAAVAGTDGRGNVAVPWRATAKVKAAPTHALLEQLEYSYGPEARAIKLTGTAEFRFGKSPRFEGVLSARQADLDRALALSEGSSRLPLAVLKAFIEPLTSSYRPPFPVRLGIGVDALTLAGGTLQNVRGDIKLDHDSWDVETLEFRAPGFAQVRLSGTVARATQGVTFKGPAQIEATDPKAFVAWLEGRSDPAQRQAGLLRAAGDLTVGPQQFAVDRLKFEFDRKTIEGRIAYAGADGPRPPRLDADLKAAELDVDGVFAFARAALDGSAIERPREVALTVDIGRANVGGVDVKGVSGTFKLDPAGVTFDKVRIADLAEAAFSLNGRMEGALDAPRGTVTFDVDARGLDGTIALLAKYLPEAAEPMRHAASRIVPLKARATIGIEPVSSTDPRGNSKVKLDLEGSGGALRTKIAAEAAGDVGALALPVFRLDGQVSATDGTALAALLGLDRVVTVDKRQGTLSISVRSAAGSDARVDARFNAGGLAATANGTARLFHADGLATALDMTVQAADASPLRRGVVAQPPTLLPVALRAKLNASANELALENLSGVVGGAPVRGNLKLGLGAAKRIDGKIETDSADLGALVAIAAGMPRSPARADTPVWAGEPFGDSALTDYSGRIEFTAVRATLAPNLIGRQVRGAVRLAPGEVAIEEVEGTLAGGRASGQLVLRRNADGLGARGRIALTGADAATLLPGEGKPPVTGRVALQAEVEGSGLSPASLIGSLAGTGTITLEDAQISGLDPKAFNAAISAVDRGLAVDAPRIRDIVSTVLDGGRLAVPRLDAPLTINSGQVRIAPTLVLGQGADLGLSASADLADASIDVRLTLSGPMITEGTSAIRPEIPVALKGPYAAPKRTIDVSALSGWLMLRSVERQAKQIDSIEAERREVERRDAERREVERLAAEKRDADRREAERREAERRDAEAKATTSTVPAALPVPAPIMEEPPAAVTPPPRVVRPNVPARAPVAAAEPAPALPPPMNIGPAPGAAKSTRLPRPPGAATAQNPQAHPANPPPVAPRSALDTFLGIQR